MEIDVGTIIRLKSKRDAAGPVSEHCYGAPKHRPHDWRVETARRNHRLQERGIRSKVHPEQSQEYVIPSLACASTTTLNHGRIGDPSVG